MLMATEPQAAERETADDDDLCHLVCADHAPDRSLCGRDVSADPWLRQGQAVLECVVCDDIDEVYERQGWCCEAAGIERKIGNDASLSDRDTERQQPDGAQATGADHQHRLALASSYARRQAGYPHR